MKKIATMLLLLMLVPLCLTLAACGGGSGGTGPQPSVQTITVVPTGVMAAAGNGQVSIGWSEVAGATSYNLYWSNTAGVTKNNGTKIAGVTSPHAHTGLTNGTVYHYVVTAVGSGGESNESAEVTATRRHRLLGKV